MSKLVARADVLMSTAHKMAASNHIKEVIKSVDKNNCQKAPSQIVRSGFAAVLN